MFAGAQAASMALTRTDTAGPRPKYPESRHGTKCTNPAFTERDTAKGSRHHPCRPPAGYLNEATDLRAATVLTPRCHPNY